MTAIPVHRYMFTVDEVVAAILPNVGRAREVEMRIDADGYVVVDIVAPSSGAAPQQRPAEAPQTDGDFPGDKPAPVSTSSPAGPATDRGAPGPTEEEALVLCRTPLFRAFLEVKTEEAAVKVLAGRCRVADLAELDRSRSNGMNLRHVVEEFEAWKIT